MGEIRKLEDIVKVKEGKYDKYIDLDDVLNNIDKLKEEDYNFIDYRGYNPAEIKNIYNVSKEINKIIPKNSAKQVALIYSKSIEKAYLDSTDNIVGYLTKSPKAIPLKEYLEKYLKNYTDKHGQECHKQLTIIIDMAEELDEIVSKLIRDGMYESMPPVSIYDSIPPSAFNTENIQVDKNNNLILMNTNYKLIGNETELSPGKKTLLSIESFNGDYEKYNDKVIKPYRKYSRIIDYEEEKTMDTLLDITHTILYKKYGKEFNKDLDYFIKNIADIEEDSIYDSNKTLGKAKTSNDDNNDRNKEM